MFLLLTNKCFSKYKECNSYRTSLQYFIQNEYCKYKHKFAYDNNILILEIKFDYALYD